MEFARKGVGNCKEKKIQEKAPKFAFVGNLQGKKLRAQNLQGMRMLIASSQTVVSITVL